MTSMIWDFLNFEYGLDRVWKHLQAAAWSYGPFLWILIAVWARVTAANYDGPLVNWLQSALRTAMSQAVILTETCFEQTRFSAFSLIQTIHRPFVIRERRFWV